MYTDGDKSRMRWRSRRGLLELDLVFARYLEHDFDRMTEAELVVYDDLLNTPDIELLEWVDGKSQPTDQRFSPLVERLRHWQAPDNQQ
ncbi:succinate dehydrogenase assembly factor 2 [Burkholderiaceae bacterium DAT-1]|nr:succinate dehydrogenase assembly factor 2 [Burkholderiaceae bacterium DAT-1]